MAAFDLKFFMGGIVMSASPLLGAKIMIEEIPSLLFASAPPAATPVHSEPSSPMGSEHSLVVAAAPAAASARWPEEDAAEQAQRLAEASGSAGQLPGRTQTRLSWTPWPRRCRPATACGVVWGGPEHVVQWWRPFFDALSDVPLMPLQNGRVLLGVVQNEVIGSGWC